MKGFSLENFGVTKEFRLNNETIENFNIHLDNDKLNIKFGYYKAIDSLKNLILTKSPFHKMKILKLTSESILNSIIEFYNDFDISANIDNFTFEEFSFIFLHSLIQSENSNIVSELNFILVFIEKLFFIKTEEYYLICLKDLVSFLSRDYY